MTKAGEACHATRPCLSGFGAGLLGDKVAVPYAGTNAQMPLLHLHTPAPPVHPCPPFTPLPTHMQQLKQEQGPLPDTPKSLNTRCLAFSPVTIST